MKTTKPFGLRLFTLLAVFALVVAACTSTEPAEPTNGGATSATTDGDGTTAGADSGGVTPVEGAVFNVGFPTNITTDNWWASLDTQSSFANQAYLTNARVQLYDLTNPGFVYIPEIGATETPVAAVQEGDLWVVEQPIRQDMTWSDGESVTADDLAFYFDTVREFRLGSNHASTFPPTVLSITAPDDFTVRVEFDSEPGLAVWQNGVGFATFVPSHFWAAHVEEARAAGAKVFASTTADDAIMALVDASLVDEDPSNDLTAADITREQIDDFIAGAGATESLTVLYSVSAPMEPSVGSQIFAQWETGAFAATTSNPTYFENGTENTFHDDLSGELHVSSVDLDDRGAE